jgi:ribosomal protein S18 acetylase RimI-like enzyme
MRIEKEIVELTSNLVSKNMLDDFIRTQAVTKHFFMRDGKKIVRDVEFIDDWTIEERHQIIEDFFIPHNDTNYYVLFCMISDKIAGFMVLDCNPIGEEKEYLELKMLHVSNQYRGYGIGRELFLYAVDKARLLNASKLYLSAHSAYESQKFYESVGCIDATWLYQKAVEAEPYDIQMEYVL